MKHCCYHSYYYSFLLRYLTTTTYAFPFQTQEHSNDLEADSSSQIWVLTETQDGNTVKNTNSLIPHIEFEQVEDILEQTDSKHYPPKPNNRIKRKKLKRKSIYRTVSNSKCEDEFDIYGKFIASQLRQMDMHRAIQLQLEIQSLVSEARMADL